MNVHLDEIRQNREKRERKLEKKMRDLNREFHEMSRLSIFEIEVVDAKTQELTHIVFDINLDVDNQTLIARHEPLTQEQVESKKIAFVEVEIDLFFSLDENLQGLFEKCIEAINMSDFYQLPKD